MIINRDVYEHSYTDEELIKRIENAESWDEVTDEMTVLADRYNIDEHTEAGEWKLGDELLDEIKAAMKRYLVINQYEDDNSIRVCESLEDANAEAESTWSAMCGADQKRHHVYVIDVTGKDVGWEDGEPVWEDYHCGGYEPGRFDADYADYGMK